LSVEAIPPKNCTDTSSGSDPEQKTINKVNFTVFNLDKEMSVVQSTSAREYCTIKSGVEYKIITKLSSEKTSLNVEKDPVLNEMLESFQFNN
jgi:hypothetical protein